MIRTKYRINFFESIALKWTLTTHHLQILSFKKEYWPPFTKPRPFFLDYNIHFDPTFTPHPLIYPRSLLTTPTFKLNPSSTPFLDNTPPYFSFQRPIFYLQPLAHSLLTLFPPLYSIQNLHSILIYIFLQLLYSHLLYSLTYILSILT